MSNTTEVKVVEDEVAIENQTIIKNKTVANDKIVNKEDIVAKQKISPAQPQSKDIIIDLTLSSKLEIISTATSEKNQMIISNSKISLTRGQNYKIPITNKVINYDNSYVIKVSKDFRLYIQILDVSDGFVTISPIVHNTILKSGDKIGTII